MNILSVGMPLWVWKAQGRCSDVGFMDTNKEISCVLDTNRLSAPIGFKYLFYSFLEQKPVYTTASTNQMPVEIFHISGWRTKTRAIVGHSHDSFRPEAVRLFFQFINSLTYSANIHCEASACKVSKRQNTVLTLSLSQSTWWQIFEQIVMKQCSLCGECPQSHGNADKGVTHTI